MEWIYDFDWGEGVIISQMAVQSIWGKKWLYPAQLVRTNNQNQRGCPGDQYSVTADLFGK